MLCNFRLIVAILALVQLSIAHGEGLLRERRRLSKPRTDKPLTLDELLFECCTAHPMWGCCEGVLLYTDMDSELNLWQAGCLETAELNRMSNNKNVITIDITGDETASNTPGSYNVEQQPQMTTSSSQCSLNKTQKGVVRDLYCRHFEFLFMYFRSNVYRSDVLNPGIDSLVDCVNYFPSNEYFSPAEIQETVALWYTTTIKRHHCCNFPWYHSSLNDPFTMVRCRQDRREAATRKWGELMVKTAKVMRMVTMLENLGRRKMCLRGCVGGDEVECCNILFR